MSEFPEEDTAAEPSIVTSPALCYFQDKSQGQPRGREINHFWMGKPAKSHHRKGTDKEGRTGTMLYFISSCHQCGACCLASGLASLTCDPQVMTQLKKRMEMTILLN
jgi:hypothetical protein